MVPPIFICVSLGSVSVMGAGRGFDGLEVQPIGGGGRLAGGVAGFGVVVVLGGFFCGVHLVVVVPR